MSKIPHKDRVTTIFGGGGIATRLLILIIGFSSLVTLTATSLQLYTDYQRDLNSIESRLHNIEASYLASLSASLWNLDVNQLTLQLDGIQHLPDIVSAQIQENQGELSNPLSVVRGDINAPADMVHTTKLIYEQNGATREIGLLTIRVSLADIRQRLWDKAVFILLSQGIKTFLVSLFTLAIFYFLVTRHLNHIVHYLNQYTLGQTQNKLSLNRKKKRQTDELDALVIAYNQMHDELSRAYQELAASNIQLQKDIEARKIAEQEVLRLNSVLEQKVLQRTAELEAANQELSSFCYSVSHDLRAPLRRIEGFRRILSEDYHQNLDEQANHYLSRIEASTTEMANMIESFLRLSRSTQGELSLSIINLSQKVEHLLASLTERDPDRKYQFTIEPNLTANVDPRFIDVLLTNLVDNAWKYTRNQEITRIAFGWTVTEQGGEFYLKDNGAGFNSNFADRLFTPFNRMHSQEQFEGTGIGLATAHRIVARHGGQIRAVAAINQGATFYFSFWNKART